MKERIKTFVLVLLILGAVIMTGQVWVFGRLMPGNAMTFSQLMAILGSDISGNMIRTVLTGEKTIETGTDLFTPAVLAYSTGGERQVIYGNARQLQLAKPVLFEEIGWLLSQGGDYAEVTDQAEWQKAISSESVFIDFGEDLRMDLMLGYFHAGPGKYPADFLFRYCAIEMNGEDQTTILYFKNRLDGKIIRYVQSGTEELAGILSERKSTNSEGKWLFPFEAGEGSELYARAKTIRLPDELLFPPKLMTIQDIIPSNPFDSAQGNEAMLIVAKAFGYSASTIRQYTEKDGTLVYVENFGTLRISPKGEVSFISTESGKGVNLIDLLGEKVGELTYYDLVDGAYRLFTKMGVNIIGGTAGQVQYCAMAYSSAEDAFMLYFDYVSAGIPIDVTDPDLNPRREEFPIVIRIQGGAVTGAEIRLRLYSLSEDDTQPVISPLSVLDMLRYKGVTALSDLGLRYEDDGAGTAKAAGWAAYGRES